MNSRHALIAGFALMLATAMLATPAATALATAPSLEQNQSKRVNVNTATQKELESLPGIGPKIAQEIIKHRPYRNGQDLQEKVKGIGPKTWADIKNLVTFGR